MIGALKSSAALVSFFALLSMQFVLLAIAGFRNSTPINKAGGWFGIFASLVAFYIAASGLYHREYVLPPLESNGEIHRCSFVRTSYLVLPVGPLHSKDNDSYNHNNTHGATSGAEMTHANNGTNGPRRGLFGKKSAA